MKFHSLAAPVPGEVRARRIVETVDEIDSLKDIRDLTILLVSV